MAAEMVGGNGGRSRGCGQGGGLGTSVRTMRLMGGPHTVLIFFYLSKTGSTLKIQKGCLILLQKFPIFACGSLGILNNFLNCAWHPILKINKAKNPGSNSTFESLMNFKRGLNLLKNLINFLKFFLDLIFIKMNLVGIIYMQECELSYKCQTTEFK
jgi:hypothetical protein